MIYVFGSNSAGRHGAGTAATARRLHGAIYGQAEGRQGNSYAIPTRAYVGGSFKTLPRNLVETHVKEFITYALDHPELIFQVTDIGCGLAGFTPEEIAPMFRLTPENCKFSLRFRDILERIW